MVTKTMTKVLLNLPQDVVDQVRVVVGKAMAALKLAVSLQIVLRALIDEGLKRCDDRAFLANLEGQAKAVRHIRRLARQRQRVEGNHGNRRSDVRSRPDAREQPRRWK
jgi:hypothetical protein